jgi:hypothetical protein
MQQENNMGRQWFIYVLLTVASASIGYGISQETMHIDVVQNRDHITQLDSQLQNEVSERRVADQAQQDAANANTALMRSMIDQSSQLIQLIKVQNQILSKP